MPAKIFKTPGQNKAKNIQLYSKTSVKKKPPNTNHSESHLTQLNMPKVYLQKNYQKLLESYVVEKFADAAENPRMLMNGSD